MPKISVIVPVYNVEPYIHRCVDSILNQTFTDFELILVDDGSPDNCGKICDEYAEKDKRVHVIHQKNGGLSAARNAGIDWAFQNSNSEWITFIDSDDWVHKQYLEYLYAVAKKGNLQIVCSNQIKTDKHLDDYIVLEPKTIIGAPEQLYIDFSLDICSSCLSIYKKDLFLKLRFPLGKYFEDMQIIPSLLYSQENVAFIDEKMYYRYQNPTSITRSAKTPKYIDDLFVAYICHLRFLGQNGFILTYNDFLTDFKKYFSEFIKEYADYQGYKNIFKKNYNDAKKMMKQYEDIALPYNIQLKNYGFKKWFTGQADELEQLKCDVKNVSSERGMIFALFWRIKQRINIYNKYHNLSI